MPHNNINIAAQYIREGKLVAFPTETVYGLGANALDPIAVAKIFELKERPSFDPLIVHIADLDTLDDLTSNHDERIHKLAESFWPGPLTLILPKSNKVPDIVTSGLDTVGIRMPNNKIALELIKESGCPIAAPSANKFGRVSPTTAQHVKKQLPNVDYILDGGKTHIGIESTIVALTESGFKILRHGFITEEDILRVLPQSDITESQKELIAAPGMLKSHYSPTKPIFILGEAFPEKAIREKSGLISFFGNDIIGYKKVEILSPDKDIKKYAVNLFEAMHKFEDDPEIEYIFAEPVPEEGIGIAIMDRLKKAAYQHRIED